MTTANHGPVALALAPCWTQHDAGTGISKLHQLHTWEGQWNVLPHVGTARERAALLGSLEEGLRGSQYCIAEHLQQPSLWEGESLVLEIPDIGGSASRSSVCERTSSRRTRLTARPNNHSRPHQENGQPPCAIMCSTWFKMF